MANGNGNNGHSSLTYIARTAIAIGVGAAITDAIASRVEFGVVKERIANKADESTVRVLENRVDTLEREVNALRARTYGAIDDEQ